MPLPQPFRGKIYDDITQCIGHTPLVRLRLRATHAHLMGDWWAATPSCRSLSACGPSE